MKLITYKVSDFDDLRPVVRLGIALRRHEHGVEDNGNSYNDVKHRV